MGRYDALMDHWRTRSLWGGRVAAAWLCLLTGLLSLPAAAEGPAAGPVPVEVIAHPSVDESFLNRSYLRSVFTLRVRTWPNGEPVRIFVMADADDVHSRFAREVLGTYPYVLRRTWDRSMFTGTGLVPERVDNLEEMRRRVLTTPGAVGYMPVQSADNSQVTNRLLAGLGDTW